MGPPDAILGVTEVPEFAPVPAFVSASYSAPAPGPSFNPVPVHKSSPVQAFKKDTTAHKMNLGVGAYRCPGLLLAPAS